jgi:hypothetical protein
LANPLRPLPDLATTHLDGRPGNLRALKDQWLLVSVAGGACDAACQQHLYLQRQLREGLGKDKDRLDWVWLIPDDAPVPEAMRPRPGAGHGASRARSGAVAVARPLRPATRWRITCTWWTPRATG